MSDKKICWVVASPLTINFFLRGHITLLAKNCQLTVVTNTDDPNFLEDLGVPVTLVPMNIARNVHIWGDVRALAKLIWFLRGKKFDAVHSLSPKTGLLAMLAGWVARVPLRLHTFQGEVWITRQGLWRCVLKCMDKVVAACATHLTVVSFSERQFLIEQSITRPEKLQVLGYGSICGVNLARFKPDVEVRKRIRAELDISNSDTIILYVGRLNQDKGLLDLAHAFAHISQRRLGAHLLLVGPDEGNLRESVSFICANVHERLHFVDYTKTPELYMAASDLLCLPSYREGFGLVLIEAAATGLPTIGSRIYGITDAIADEQSGLLFHPANVSDLTTKLLRLLDEPDLGKRLGAFGMQRAQEKFSEDYVLHEMLKFYRKLL